LLTFKTEYRHQEPKAANDDIIQQSSGEQLNDASRMRSTAQSMQYQNSTIIFETYQPDKECGVVIMDRSDYIRTYAEMPSLRSVEIRPNRS
jgi:hypothetical protein